MASTQPDFYDYLNYDENSDDAISLSSQEDNNDIDIYLHSKDGIRHFKKSDEDIHASSSEYLEKSLTAQINEMCKENDHLNQNEAVNQQDDLYDSEDDVENEKWVEEIRQSYRPLNIPGFRSSNLKTKKAPLSDAVLNCPCCMSLLCIDCQRHNAYKTQYRAMFVMNCDIDASQNLFYPLSQIQQKFGTKKKIKFVPKQNNGGIEMEEEVTANSQNFDQTDILVLDGKPGPLPAHILNDEESIKNYDVYKNVACSICKTQVGVYDKEEVYHFYNVLASY